MFPVIFKIWGYEVSGYLFFNTLGILIASAFIFYKIKRVYPDKVEIILYIALFWSFFVFGSGLYYQFKHFIISPVNYVKNLKIFVHPFLREHSFFSGIVFLSLFIYFYSKRIFKKSYLKILGVTYIGIALFQSIGKLGCFSAGCCFGKPTSFFLGVKFKYLGKQFHPYAGVKIHPTQLYESFFNFLNFLFLMYLLGKGKKPEKIIGFYFINYGIIRFLEEYLRNDSGRGYLIKSNSPLLSLSIPQIYSFIFIVFGISLFLVSSKKFKKEKKV